MTLDKRIKEQVKRIEALQKDLIARGASIDDARRPEAMKRERAATVRETIAGLQRDRKETITRFDAEIAAREAELATLEGKSDIDFALQQSGGNAPPSRPRRGGAPKGKDSGRST